MIDLTEYIQWLKVHRKSTPRTRELYTYNLERFFKAIGYGEFNQANIDRFFADLHDKVESGEFSKNHVNTFIAAINSYNLFMEHKGRLRCKTPNYFAVKAQPKYVEFEKLEEIISSFDDIFQHSLQKKALMTFMLFVPLRKSDVVELKREQFDFENGFLRLNIQKTDNEVTIPIPSEVCAITRLYFMKEPEKNNAFNTSMNGIDYLFAKIKEWYGIQISPHMTRSTYAVYYLEQGGRLENLQDILGHSSIATTQRYAKLKPADLQKEVNNIFNNRKKKKR